MRIVHLSDLHFVRPGAMWKEVLKRLPYAVGGGAATWAYILYCRQRRQDPDPKILVLLGGSTVLAALNVLRPLFTHWKAHDQAREALLVALARDRPDHVVVTGDFATFADPVEFRRASDFLKRLEGLVGPGRVTVTPGNHDAPVPIGPNPMRRQPPERKFQQYLSQFGSYHDVKPLFPAVRQHGDVCLVAMDSVTLSFPINSNGLVSEEQLDRATDALHRPEARDSFKVLCLHHPLVLRSGLPTFSEESRLVTGPLENRDHVMRWAQESKIGLVLCGHDHTMYQETKHVPMYCAGSTPKLIDEQAPVSYRVFDVQGGGLEVADRRVDPARVEDPQVALA